MGEGEPTVVVGDVGPIPIQVGGHVRLERPVRLVRRHVQPGHVLGAGGVVSRQGEVADRPARHGGDRAVGEPALPGIAVELHHERGAPQEAGDVPHPHPGGLQAGGVVLADGPEGQGVGGRAGDVGGHPLGGLGDDRLREGQEQAPLALPAERLSDQPERGGLAGASQCLDGHRLAGHGQVDGGLLLGGGGKGLAGHGGPPWSISGHLAPVRANLRGHARRLQALGGRITRPRRP